MNQGGLYIMYKRITSALFSGNKAAYLGMLVKVLRPFTMMLDSIKTNKITEEQRNNFKIPPCIMLVSPSRSGSTIIYQVLTRTIPCVYISNYHNLYPGSASAKMTKRDLFGKDGDNLNNFYGYTSSLYDVSEGNEILEKIFEHNPKVGEIRKRFIDFLIHIGASSERPLIFKNVQSYHHLSRLHEAVPELMFLRISRSTEKVAQSMLRAYHELGYFYSTPDEVKAHDTEDPIEFTVLHLLGIEKNIEKQLESVSADNVIRWTYEEFCSAPEKMMQDLLNRLFEQNAIAPRMNPLNVHLSVSNRIKISPEEAEKIKNYILKHS